MCKQVLVIHMSRRVVELLASTMIMMMFILIITVLYLGYINRFEDFNWCISILKKKNIVQM